MIEYSVGERCKTIPLRHPDRRISIMRRPDGMFFYIEERFWHPAEDDGGIELGWQAEAESGIFASAEAAEAEVAAQLARSSN